MASPELGSAVNTLTSTSATIATDSPGPESDVTELGRSAPLVPIFGLASYRSRLVADAIKISVSELRKDNELAMSQYAHD